MVIFQIIAVLMALGLPFYIWVELVERKQKFCGGLWHRLRYWKSAYHVDGGCMGDSGVMSYYCVKCERAFNQHTIQPCVAEPFGEVFEVMASDTFFFERTKNFATGVWKDKR